MSVAAIFCFPTIRSMLSMRCDVWGIPTRQSDMRIPSSVFIVLSGMMLISASSCCTCAYAVGLMTGVEAAQRARMVASFNGFIVVKRFCTCKDCLIDLTGWKRKSLLFGFFSLRSRVRPSVRDSFHGSSDPEPWRQLPCG